MSLRLRLLLLLLCHLGLAAAQNSNYWWQWVSGSSKNDAKGSYSGQGVAAASNVPSARYYHSMVYAPTDNSVWLFGGYNHVVFFNEMWQWDVNGKQWTWWTGASNTNVQGVYGTLGTAARFCLFVFCCCFSAVLSHFALQNAANSPGGRDMAGTVAARCVSRPIVCFLFLFQAWFSTAQATLSGCSLATATHSRRRSG